MGDFVEFSNGVIEAIIERKNFLSRPSVANIDQVIIVSALKEPDLNLTQLNRYIALAKYHNIDAILCFNKSDLECGKHTKDKILDIYKPMGYEIIFTSAKEHKGIKEFKKLLNNKTSVLCGSSGAGKSSLINTLDPKLNLRTKRVSEKIGRGTHTTRHCEIIKIDNSLKILDTPGFSNVRFDFILPEDIDLLFTDIALFRNFCKYSNCLHQNEDGCAVLANLDKIDISRYESYLTFINEANEFKNKLKQEGAKTEQTKKMVNKKEIVKISSKKRQLARNNLKQLLYKELENDE